NAIVDMYAKCGKMDQANRFFERMELKDVVSWNIMVMGYSQTRIFRNPPPFTTTSGQPFTIIIFIFFTIIPIHHCLFPATITSITITSAPLQPPPFTTTSGDNPHRRAPFSSSSPLLTSAEPKNHSASSSSPPKPRAAVATFSISGSPLVCHQTAATPNLLRSVLTAFQPVTTPLHTNEPATFSSLSLTGRTAALSTSHSDTDDEPLSPLLLPSLSSRLTIANQPNTVAIPAPFPVLPWNDQNRVQPL
ncbi:hypothetical protein S245_000375, partial [Arachis hypogaea]